MPWRTPNRARQTQRLLALMLQKPPARRFASALLKITDLQSAKFYPALLRLCDQGLLEAQRREAEKFGKPPNHVYRLINAGLAFAREQAAQPSTRTFSPLGART